MKKKIKLLLFASLILLCGCSVIHLPKETYKANQVNDRENQKIPIVYDEVISDDNELESEEAPGTTNTKTIFKEIKIICVGDVMFHLPQVNYAKGLSGYDFSESFEEIKDFISKYDLALANFETTINPELEPSGYPRFNTPVDCLTSIKSAGFDGLSTMNNHSLDTDIEGVQSTIKAFEDIGLESFGTNLPDQDQASIIDVDGILVGILGYTDSLNGLEGLLDTDEKKEMLNTLWDEDHIRSQISKLKNSVDLVIIYPHWGNEYESHQSTRQIELGHKMVDWGADIIIGSHPHVVQPSEIYKASDGRQGFITYSCGNFLSSQSLENNDDIRVEQSIAYEINLEKNMTNGKTIFTNVQPHPLWVGKRQGVNGQVIKTHLCTDYLEGGDKYNDIGPETRSRIQKAYDNTIEILSSQS